MRTRFCIRCGKMFERVLHASAFVHPGLNSIGAAIPIMCKTCYFKMLEDGSK